nr:BamA/TamA family outer membrane protein [Pacificimonas pallii]
MYAYVRLLTLALVVSSRAWAQDTAPARTVSDPLPAIPEIEADWQDLFGRLEEEDQTEAARPVTAIRYSVEFLPELLPAIAGPFRELSLLLTGNGASVPSLAELNRRVRVDRDLISRLLRAEGYYDPLIDISIINPDEPVAARRVVFEVDAGPLYRFDDIAATGLSVNNGDPVRAGAVLGALGELRLRLPREGYPFADVPDPEIIIDHETRRASLALNVRTGPRGRFGSIRVLGEDAPFDADHVNLLARFEAGDVYDAADIDDLRRALIATGLVGSADITPVKGAPINEVEAEVDLDVDLTSAPARTLAAQFAYDTEDGFRVEGSWQHRNFFRPEGAVTARLALGTEEQLLALDLRRSNYGARDRIVGGRVAAFREDRDAFFRRGVLASAFIERETNLIWQKRWTYRLGPELIFSQERDRSALLGVPARLNTYYVAAFPAQLTYDGTDDLLDPSEGFRLLGRLSPEISFQGGTFTYARSEVGASAYLPLGEERKTVIAGRALVGSILGSGRRNIAPSRRFYAGGGASVRGFGFQDVGPRDADGEPLGGRSKVEASIEARHRFGDLGAVAFVDAGQVYTSSAPGFDDFRFGIGVGARYYTRFGPIRIDIATPIKRRSGESPVAVYVSIGQAF